MRWRRPVRFAVDDDGRLHVSGKAKRTLELTFFAPGLLVDTAQGEHAVALPWDDCYRIGTDDAPVDSWGITFYGATGSASFGVAVYASGAHAESTRPLYEETMPLRRRVAHTLDAVYVDGHVMPVVPGGPYTACPAERATLGALTEVLARRPALRLRLEGPERMAPLARAIARNLQREPRPAHAILPESVAVLDAMRAAGLVHEFGRPLAKAEVPFDEAVRRTRQFVNAEDQGLRRLVKRFYCDVAPWPFGPLVAP